MKHNLLSKDNNFYKYLILNQKNIAYDFLIVPNLDYNDKYLYSKSNFLGQIFTQNNKLNIKYKTNYQILVHSIKNDGFYYIKVYLFYDNKKYLVLETKKNKLNYNNFFNLVKVSILEKWKTINKIDTKVINSLDCKIIINNVSELGYVRNKLKKNLMVKNFNLKTIKLNENTYQVFFIGNTDILIKSLQRDRLQLFIENNSCNIKLT